MYVLRKIVTLMASLPVIPQGLSPVLTVHLAGRLIVYFAALGCVTLVFLIGRTLRHEDVGRMAAMLLSVMPGFVISSHYFRVDTPMVFWVLATLLALCRLIATGRFAYALLAGLLLGYSASTKYNASVLVIAGLVAIVMAGCRLDRWRAGLAFLVCASAGFIVGTPYALLKTGRFLEQLRWVAATDAAAAVYSIARPPTPVDYLINIIPIALTWAVAISTPLALIWTALRGGRILWLVLVFLASLFLPLAFTQLRLIRYTAPLLPLIALVVAHWLHNVISIRRLRLVGLLGFGIMVGYGLVYSYSYVQVMAQVDPRAQASSWIQENLPRDVPLPVSTVHYLDVPQLRHFGYQPLETAFDAEALEEARSPYLVLSSITARFFEDVLDRHPRQLSFYRYVQANYAEVISFENEQTFFGIDSRADSRRLHDMQYPNPRITILRRLDRAQRDGG
jgi:Dolichyl-phosphate-mannose-protein mannosyltransferase